MNADPWGSGSSTLRTGNMFHCFLRTWIQIPVYGSGIPSNTDPGHTERLKSFFDDLFVQRNNMAFKIILCYKILSSNVFIIINIQQFKLYYKNNFCHFRLLLNGSKNRTGSGWLSSTVFLQQPNAFNWQICQSYILVKIKNNQRSWN